jgi:hypothetical protein
MNVKTIAFLGRVRNPKKKKQMKSKGTYMRLSGSTDRLCHLGISWFSKKLPRRVGSYRDELVIDIAI